MSRPDSADSRFAAIVSRSEEDLNLGEAALVMASAEYPDLDVAAYLGRLDDLAAGVRRTTRAREPHRLAQAMSEYLFQEIGFAGNQEDYSDPRNSFLNEVLDRRLGIPVSLSVVYMEVGRRLGVPVSGVSFPGHFLVMVDDGKVTTVLDPFFQGVAVDEQELAWRLRRILGDEVPVARYLPHLLEPATKAQILIRMLRNLKAIYGQRGDPMRALGYIGRILAVDATIPGEYRDRARLYAELECPRAALDDYTRYLSLADEPEDEDEVREQMSALRAAAARIN